MSDWRDSTYHYTAGLFILRPEIVFCAQVDALTFQWTEIFQPAGTIRHIYPKNIAYGSMTGGDVLEGRTLLAGTAPGRDDLGRCRCMGTTNIVHEGSTYHCVSVWVSNQGTNDGELNLSTDAYITIVDERRIWGKKPFVTSDGYVYKDGLGVAFAETVPPIANAGQAYMNIPGSAAPASVNFSGTASYATEPGATLEFYGWQFPGCSPSYQNTAIVSGVSVPAGFRYVSLTVRDDTEGTYDPAHTAWVPVAVRDGVAKQEGFIDAFEVTQHRHEVSGQSMTFKVYEDLPSGKAYFDALRANTLTAYYVCNDQSPSTILDYSGHQRNASGVDHHLMTAGVTGACGRLRALRLSGATDYIRNTSTLSSAMNTENGALTLMVRASDLNSWDYNDNITLVNIGPSVGSAESAIRVYVDAQNLITVALIDSESNTTTRQYVPDSLFLYDGVWYGIAITWSLTDGVKVFVNGEQVGETWADFAGFTTGNLYAGYHWAGDIQHLAVIDGAPSDMSVLGVPDRRIERVLDGAPVIYAEREVYGGVVGSLGDAGQAGREHVKFYGWIHRMRMDHEADELGGRVYTEVECLDAGKRLELLNRQEFVHERGTPSTESEWAFIRVASLNADRAAVMVLFYDSNVLDLANFVWSGTGEQYAYPWWRITEDNLYEAVDVICQKIAHKLTCDKTGTLRMVRDQQLALPALRTSTALEVIHPSDVSRLEYAYSRSPRVYWNWGYAVQANTGNAVDNPDITVFRSVSPGPVPGQGQSSQEYDEQVVRDQDDLNVREGQRYHLANAPWSNFNVELAYPGDRGWDAARGQMVQLALPRTRAAQSGITFPFPEYHEKVLSTSPQTLIQYLRLNEKTAGSLLQSGTAPLYDCSPAGNHGYCDLKRANGLGIGDGYSSIYFTSDYGIGFNNGGSLLGPSPTTPNSFAQDADVNAFTALVWFRLSTSIWAQNSSSVLYQVGSVTPPYILIKRNGINSMAWMHSVGGTTKTITASLSDDKWHCAAITISGTSEMRAYLDGSLVDIRTGLGTWSSPNITFGGIFFGTFDGWGAHVATWASVLSAAQISDLARLDNRFYVYGVDIEHNAQAHTKRVMLELEHEITAPPAHTVVVEGETGGTTNRLPDMRINMALLMGADSIRRIDAEVNIDMALTMTALPDAIWPAGSTWAYWFDFLNIDPDDYGVDVEKGHWTEYEGIVCDNEAGPTPDYYWMWVRWPDVEQTGAVVTFAQLVFAPCLSPGGAWLENIVIGPEVLHIGSGSTWDVLITHPTSNNQPVECGDAHQWQGYEEMNSAEEGEFNTSFRTTLNVYKPTLPWKLARVILAGSGTPPWTSLQNLV